MKNTITTIFLLVVCVIMISGITMAYFTGVSDESKIYFTAGDLEVDIVHVNVEGGWEDWKPDGSNAKEISWKFRNTGSKRAYLRVKIGTEWQRGEVAVVSSELYGSVVGSVYGETLVEEDDVIFNINNVVWKQVGDSRWKHQEEDGYWYYSEIVNPGEEVTLSFKVSINTINGYMGAKYKINLTAESIQASNNAVSKWNLPFD